MTRALSTRVHLVQRAPILASQTQPPWRRLVTFSSSYTRRFNALEHRAAWHDTIHGLPESKTPVYLPRTAKYERLLLPSQSQPLVPTGSQPIACRLLCTARDSTRDTTPAPSPGPRETSSGATKTTWRVFDYVILDNCRTWKNLRSHLGEYDTWCNQQYLVFLLITLKPSSWHNAAIHKCSWWRRFHTN